VIKIIRQRFSGNAYNKELFAVVATSTTSRHRNR
jgi:hypothetical protein